MRLVILGAAVLTLVGASYGSLAAQEAAFGAMPKVAGRPAAKPSIKLPQAEVEGVSAQAARFSATLGALQPDARAATRGAKEIQVYQQAAPSVVLVVTTDAFGSGALVAADGKIVTNLHVVEDNDEVGVIFKPATDGAEPTAADMRIAKVIRRDEVADLALLQVSDIPSGVKPLALGASSAVPVGSDVHAIGHPTGESWTYTRGIVSQVRKDYAWQAEDRLKHTATVIQTQTPINPGNSGGPLIDDTLQIVGINSFKGDGEGLNFAVSAEDVKAFLARTDDRLISGGRKVRAAAAKACEEKVLEEVAISTPKGMMYAIDGDCDDKPDFVFMEPEDETLPTRVILDDDMDGVIDTVIFDEGRDGAPDFALFDTDKNGKPDMRGDYRKGEDEPYRWEKIQEP